MIDELKNTDENATNRKIRDCFDVLYFKKRINNNTSHYYVNGNYVKVFPKDNLKQIDKLTINLEKYSETLPKTNFDTGLTNPSTYKCICNIDSTATDSPLDTECPIHYSKHPLYYGFQTQFLFKVGVYEPHFNKKVFN
jgi:hypothetical protein